MAATVVVHLTASRFFGGPERQMLGLARTLGPEYRTAFVSFAEGGRCQAFLDEVRRFGFEGVALRHDTPRLLAAAAELTDVLRRVGASVLCAHGYKSGLLGRWAARRLRVPIVGVSRGWTGEDFKVRLYEALDRFGLRWMDRIVSVSHGQAAKVLRTGVPAARTLVIPNAIHPERFAAPDPADRQRLRAFFPDPPARVVGAAGRLSPDKGFAVFVTAAARVARRDPGVGFVLFGDGPLRKRLERQAHAAGLAGRFVLAGFRTDLDRFMPFLDLLVLPSYNEGLPNVVLEAFAAGIPVVATAVGGTPEVVEDGQSGYLVEPGNVGTLTRRIRDALAGDERRREFGRRGRERVLRDYTFPAQAREYQRLFAELGVGPA